MSLPVPVLPTGLQLLQYGLPALLGYVLYVGIAGRFAPGRPAPVEARPAWLLGAWTGVSVAAVLGTAAHLAYGLPLDRAPVLFRTAAWSLGAALLPGCLAWLAYRRAVRRVAARNAAARVDAPFGLDVPDVDVASPLGDAPEEPEDGATDDEVDETLVDVRYVPIPNAADAEARRALEDERRLREQTEKHLQVTRRALYSLDAAAREGEDERADTLIALETELEAHVRRSSAAEARATHEECGRVRAETTASQLKHEVLRLRSELRRAAEGRARAVATAGKSVAFARRAMQARATLEERLRETGEALANRQETISSLIRALEAEKGRTEEQVASRAKQLVLHERQLRERRSLEELARSVEGKLSTRLVKKVARARPLAGT